MAKKTTFEGKLDLLEGVVKKMEDGQMSLSDTLKAYEEGMRLVGELKKELNTAEKRMIELSNADFAPEGEAL